GTDFGFRLWFWMAMTGHRAQLDPNPQSQIQNPLERVLAKAKTSGIRVNLLAKELEVESKDILSKLKSEGLDWAPNHMSTLSVGQAETVRGWVNSGEIARTAGGGGVAVEAPPETAVKAKAPRRKPAKKTAGEEGG